MALSHRQPGGCRPPQAPNCTAAENLQQRSSVFEKKTARKEVSGHTLGSRGGTADRCSEPHPGQRGQLSAHAHLPASQAEGPAGTVLSSKPPPGRSWSPARRGLSRGRPAPPRCARHAVAGRSQHVLPASSQQHPPLAGPPECPQQQLQRRGRGSQQQEHNLWREALQLSSRGMRPYARLG